MSRCRARGRKPESLRYGAGDADQTQGHGDILDKDTET